MLGARPSQGYDTSITNPETIIGDKFSGYFRKLYKSEYYVNPQAGFIGLLELIPDNYHVGVVYNSSNQNYGKGAFESYPNDTLILKLIKVDSPSPETTPVAWNLKMKNVYRIPYTNLQNTTTIKTKFNSNNVLLDTIPGYNIPLITMLKLDRYNNTTFFPPPDGKFDWISDRTIFPSTGNVMFPMLEPFSKGFAAYGLDSNYIYTELYSQKKIIAQQSPKGYLYVIKGNAVY
jgi:cell surface protein SprA